MPFDESIAWFWLPFGVHPSVDWGKLDTIVDTTDPTIRVGVGELEKGIEGFRASHHQAVTAYKVAIAAQPPHRVIFLPRLSL